ncbi:DUF3923 domain-containing protein [Staphylococcus succinus]|nr:DUF3923 domain-containing protein [Staphylococcus succinus]
MKISWLFWWIVTILEVLSFAILSIFLWMRDVDAGGITQTTEIKWINIAVLAVAYMVPFIIQFVWLIINLVFRNKQTTEQYL